MRSFKKYPFIFLLFSFIAATGQGFAKSKSAKSSKPSKSPNYEKEVLCNSPRIIVFRNFLTPEECDHLISYSKPYLKRSTVIDDKSSGSLKDDRRTSEGMFMPYNHGDLKIQKIEERISKVTSIPVSHGESIQVLHYQVGGEYQPHYDFFDPSTAGGLHHYNRGGQRVCSFLMYLNTPDEGGATVFPNVNIAVQPRKGDALLFYNINEMGQTDRLSLHGGAPVVRGEKWLATKWLREKEFD